MPGAHLSSRKPGAFTTSSAITSAWKHFEIYADDRDLMFWMRELAPETINTFLSKQNLRTAALPCLTNRPSAKNYCRRCCPILQQGILRALKNGAIHWPSAAYVLRRLFSGGRAVKA